jgi:chemotaxis protein methyltransferase CheR
MKGSLIDMDNIEIVHKLENIIKNETGIVIDKERLVDLDIVLKSRLILHDMKPERYIEFIKNNYDEIIFVASCFTIQETSFYRYKAHFDRMKFEIIPELIMNNKDKKILILSAGCATGEEPYTLAMLLNDLIPNIKDWNIKIIATDINENALKIANDAIYSEYKLRNIDPWYINRYFTVMQLGRNKLYKLNESIKNLVTFRQCNLIREPFELNDLSNVDIIFCENVIIYFCLESIQRLINNFYNILKKGGYLFLGYSETLNFVKHNFVLSWWNDSFTYKKADKEKSIEEINYNINELIYSNEVKEAIDEEGSTGISGRSYDDIIHLVIRNYKDDLFDNVAALLKKIENSDIKIDEMFYIIKAEFKFDKKDYINATNECRKAININPHSIDAHIILGAIYLELEMLDSAEFEIKTSLFIDKNSILANYFYALLNKKINNNAEYTNYLSIARNLLNENKGVLAVRLYPINKKTWKEIYDNILSFKN